MTGIEPSVRGSDTYYVAGKPALLFGNDLQAMRRTGDLLDSAGVRLAGQGALGEAVDRLDAQVAVGLVWIECGETGDVPSDALLDRLARLATSGEAAVVASAPPAMIDLLFARLDRSPAQILIDPDDLQRAGGAVACAGRSGASGAGQRCRPRQCGAPAPIVRRNGADRGDARAPVVVSG